MRERMAFGPDLRRARERRGLSLEQIAERTKVAASLYAGLERNDLSRWPSGLFRRAFVRAYADAVGLDPEDVCRRFVELFPEDGVTAAASTPASPAPATPPREAEPPRLTLAVPAPPVRRGHRIWRRAGAALVDIALAVVPAAIVSLLAGSGWFWLVTGAVGFTGHTLVLVAYGMTPGAWLLLGPRPVAAAKHDTPAPAPRRPEVVAGTAGPRRPSSRQASSRAIAGRRFQH